LWTWRERLAFVVMAGLVPAINASQHDEKDVDARDKAAHDDLGWSRRDDGLV
jgi:hypothetical protein